LIASSFRVQPNIFPNDPPYRPGTVFVPFDEFGAHDTDFDGDHFDNWSNEFTKDNDIQIRKAGGAGYFCRVEDHINIGGNDPIFEPMYWEDKDLFMRMQMEGYKFIMTSKSLIWHFTSRTSANDRNDFEYDHYFTGYFNTTTALTGMKFEMSNGNIDSGQIKLYGIR